MKKITTWAVFVADRPKGEIFKARRWMWCRPNGGKETYGPQATMDDVRDHIARVCNTWRNVVEFRKTGAVR